MLIFVVLFDQCSVVVRKDQKVITKTAPNQIRPHKPKPLLSQPIVKPKYSEDNKDETSLECKVESTKPTVMKPNPKRKYMDDEDEASFETKLESSKLKLCRAYEVENKKRRTIKLIDNKDVPQKTHHEVIH